MASYIFKACPRLKRWSSRQCPVNCAAISSSLLWQRGSRHLANCRTSRSPFTMARTRAIPVAPVGSATARCTPTFICPRLFCLRRTPSPCSPPNSLCPAPACAARRSAPLAERPPAAARNGAAVGSIGSRVDPSSSAPALGLNARVSTSSTSNPRLSKTSWTGIQYTPVLSNATDSTPLQQPPRHFL